MEYVFEWDCQIINNNSEDVAILKEKKIIKLKIILTLL